jgi:hypothetical protein
MDVKDYRKNYEAELAANAAANNEKIGAPNTFQRMALDSTNLRNNIPALLATLGNAHESTPIRETALNTLRAATFLGEQFAPFRVDFLNTLRQIAQPDTDHQLRADVLEVLAVEKDPEAQELLRRGLRDPQSALVPPPKALQLLGYDDHAGAADLALEIFHKTADLATKEAALRVLATDTKSQDLFAQLLQDKSQPRSLRALSATGLHFLNPQKFSAIARNIVMDNSDFADIRATSLGALANAPNALLGDSSFVDRVKQLGIESPSANLRAAAERLITKP